MSIKTTEARLRRRGVRWFLAITFLGAWIPWTAVGLAGLSMSDPVVQLATAAFVPALAAVVVRRWITGEGFADAGMRPRLAGAWRYYLVAAALALVVLVVSVLLALVVGFEMPALTRDDGLFLLAAPVVVIGFAPVLWGEEFGWTCYLRDRIAPGRPVLTTLLTGVIWGVWHWPLPWIGYFGSATSVTTAVVSMLLWLPLSVLLEFIIGWLWAGSGSVWPSAIMHAGSNLVVAAGLGRFLAGPGTGGVDVVTVSTLLMCAAMLPVVVWIIATRRLGQTHPDHQPLHVC